MRYSWKVLKSCLVQGVAGFPGAGGAVGTAGVAAVAGVAEAAEVAEVSELESLRFRHAIKYNGTPITRAVAPLAAQYIIKGCLTITCVSGGSGHLNIGVVSRT
jgi:hypothetical protein